MNSVLQGLPFMFVYLDDILVSSSYESVHLDHLHQVFDHLQANGLIIHPDKCTFGKTSIAFLSHQVDGSSVRPLDSKVKSVIDLPCPSTSHHLSQFLGLIIYFHCFLPNAATLLQHLHALVDHKHPLKETSSTDSLLSVFQAAKCMLSDVATFVHSLHSAPMA